MEKQIVIETDGAGINLYNAAIEGLNFYAVHLDQLYNWDKILNELTVLKGTFNIDYGVYLESLKTLISINSLLSRAIADLHLIGSGLYLSKIKLQQIFYMKHAYLIVYETFENLKIQQSFLEKIAVEAGGDFLNSFEKWKKQKNEFFKKHQMETTIRTVRNKLAGHIELDFKLWYETVILLDPKEITSIIIDYMEVLKPLQLLTTKLVYFYKDLMALTSQQLKEKNISMLDQLEQLLSKINARQPDGIKLNIDIQSLRNLL